MLTQLWYAYLFDPLFNGLMVLYNTIAHENLGLAVIYLTICIRLILLPFSVISERNKRHRHILDDKVKKIQQAFSKDKIAMKEEIRKAMKEHKVYPWASFVVLGVQAIVLVVLYQVFISGINSFNNSFAELYSSVFKPRLVDTSFLGFDISERNYWVSGAVGVFIFLINFLEISVEGRMKRLAKGDLAFLVLFPLFSFLILSFLPSVKSVFIFTSLTFSLVIYMFNYLLFDTKIERRKIGAKNKSASQLRDLSLEADPMRVLRKN